MYDLFLKASELTLNPYYKELLIDCSNGKFPEGIEFENNILTFQEEQVKPKNDKEICSIMLKWFKVLKLEKKENSYPCSPPLFPSTCTLKQVPQKSRDALILDFTISKMKELNLKEEERAELYSTIKIGLYLGYIGVHEILLQNYQIIDVPGIIIRDGHFYVDTNKQKHSVSNYYKSSVNSFD